MRILITNDDGIHAPGLVALETIARALTDERPSFSFVQPKLVNSSADSRVPPANAISR